MARRTQHTSFRFSPSDRCGLPVCARLRTKQAQQNGVRINGWEDTAVLSILANPHERPRIAILGLFCLTTNKHQTTAWLRARSGSVLTI